MHLALIDDKMNTISTTAIGMLGFAVQFTHIDEVVKILVGLATFTFVMIKIGVALTHNWEALRHPWKFIAARKQAKLEDKQ